MKMIAEYLEHALSFERLAAAESDPDLRANLEKQAAYRKLAGQRAKEQGLAHPNPPQQAELPDDSSAPDLAKTLARGTGFTVVVTDPNGREVCSVRPDWKNLN